MAQLAKSEPEMLAKFVIIWYNIMDYKILEDIMINKDKLKSILDGYIAYFPKAWEKGEMEKWQAIKCFQDNWDIDAENFEVMFANATHHAAFLLSAMNFYPRKMILNFAKADAEATRSMFRKLYDESLPLRDRVNAFQTESEALRAKFDDDGTWKNHYQKTNAISTYLWLKYPDKYYIYKYELAHAAALELSSDHQPKANGSAESMIAGFNLYDDICEVVKADTRIRDMINRHKTDSCYDDPEMKTATIDVVFYLKRFILDEKEKADGFSWFPSYEEYDPELSVDDWLELFKDKSVFTDDSFTILSRMLEMGGAATCKELSEKYGEAANYYNSGSTSLAKRVHDKTNCPIMPRDEDNARWWPILYVGRHQASDKPGEYVWKLREELKEALEAFDNTFNNSATYLDEIIASLKELGGTASLKQIYSKIEERDRLSSIKTNKNWKNAVSMYLQQHCKESKSFVEGNDNLFYSVDGIGKGIWGLIRYEPKTQPVIWKISHGKTGTGIPNELREPLKNRNVAVVHSTTSAKGVSNLSQGESFMKEIKCGDFFYLCYANEIVLLGQFVDDQPKPNSEMKEKYNSDGWYERKYVVIAESKDHTPYNSTNKWWTPNNNSTCIKVTDNKLFESIILQPYFGLSLSDLLKKPVIQYTKADFLNEVYMSESKYDELKALLLNKQNIILQGAPGVGKTYSAERLAYSIMGEKDDSRIELIQFHQNYSYEDFIMGYRPNEEGGFELKEGVFYRFCDKARKDPEHRKHFFIIDEINRGNLSKIFGELLMLIEKDYRKRNAKLAYIDEAFSVPDNLYIIGMMNTADRSLALIDYALRRRFSFFEMEPGFDSDGFKKYAESLNNAKFNDLIKQVVELNIAITDDKSLGKGFMIGHSYFCGRNAEDCTIDWLRSVVKYDILPTLEEYWFDDMDKVSDWKKKLNGALND